MPIDQKILEIIPEEKYRELEKAGYKIVTCETRDQIAFTDLEPALELIQQAEDDIRSYFWKSNEIRRLTRDLEQAGEGITGQYGIEISLPKAKGVTSDPVSREASKREKQWKRVEKLGKSVSRIERVLDKMKDERERTVLSCMLDGMRMKDIARHLGISRPTLNEIKNKIVKNMAWMIHDQDQKDKE